jgi:hypothetical protein
MTITSTEPTTITPTAAPCPPWCPQVGNHPWQVSEIDDGVGRRTHRLELSTIEGAEIGVEQWEFTDGGSNRATVELCAGNGVDLETPEAVERYVAAVRQAAVIAFGSTIDAPAASLDHAGSLVTADVCVADDGTSIPVICIANSETFEHAEEAFEVITDIARATRVAFPDADVVDRLASIAVEISDRPAVETRALRQAQLDFDAAVAEVCERAGTPGNMADAAAIRLRNARAALVAARTGYVPR